MVMYLKGLDMCTCVHIFWFQTNFFSFALHKETTKAFNFSLVHFLLKMCALKGKLRVENIN